MDADEIATTLTAAILRTRGLSLNERNAKGLAAFYHQLVTALENPPPIDPHLERPE